MNVFDIAIGPLNVETPLPPGALVLRSMDGYEQLSAPFEYELELLSRDSTLKLTDLLGQPVTVSIELGLPQRKRYFHGYVTRFRLVDVEGDVATYRATVSPWLSMLSRTTNCRIFQEQSVPAVVKAVFRDHGFTDFKERLFEDYPPHEYIVQYRESDFAFVSRLLEEAGIYYYFTHEAKKHFLVLADSQGAHEKTPDYGSLPYYPPDQHRDWEEEYVRVWHVARSVQPGAVAATDYNFETSQADLSAKRAMPEQHPLADFEVFDYPGRHKDRGTGETVVRMRMEQLRATHERVRGQTNARGLQVGALFQLREHPLNAQNREYLITSSHIRLHAHDRASLERAAAHGGEEVCVCNFEALESARQFRPACTTRKPVVQGPQTAVVVGKQNEEIYTDAHGRVKVKFHWDRYATGDERSSCWVRVSQTWAGSQWGAIHIPRIGQEVIVDFLEGDPDRPIITGRVYNDMNKPPYTLPANQTQSGIKSLSSKGGGHENFNEIRFEDKKGEEELFVQAEKNQTTLVKNDQSITVKGSRTVTVSGNQTTSVSGTRTTTITKKETQTFKDAREMKVALTEDVEVTGKHTGKYHAGRDVTVDSADDTFTVNGANQQTTIHGKYDITADTCFTVTQGGNKLVIQNKIDGTTASGPITFSNGTSSIKIEGGNVTITAGESMSLVCGGATLTLGKNGTVELGGSMKTTVSGGKGVVEFSQTGATMSGPKISVSGAGTTEITGALVKIN